MSLDCSCCCLGLEGSSRTIRRLIYQAIVTLEVGMLQTITPLEGRMLQTITILEVGMLSSPLLRGMGIR